MRAELPVAGEADTLKKKNNPPFDSLSTHLVVFVSHCFKSFCHILNNISP